MEMDDLLSAHLPVYSPRDTSLAAQKPGNPTLR